MISCVLERVVMSVGGTEEMGAGVASVRVAMGEFILFSAGMGERIT